MNTLVPHSTVIRVVALVGLLVFLMLEHRGFGNSPMASHSLVEQGAWQQVVGNIDIPADSFAIQSWPIDFYALESKLWKAQSTATGKLQLDSETLAILRAASSYLPKVLSDAQAARLAKLIARSLPDRRGRELAALVIQYHAYRHAYDATIMSLVGKDAAQQRSEIQIMDSQLERQQAFYFGPTVAQQLFQLQNITTHYLNQRRLISLNSELSDSQRTLLIAALQKGYQANLALSRSDAN